MVNTEKVCVVPVAKYVFCVFSENLKVLRLSAVTKRLYFKNIYFIILQCIVSPWNVEFFWNHFVAIQWT